MYFVILAGTSDPNYTVKGKALLSIVSSYKHPSLQIMRLDYIFWLRLSLYKITLTPVPLSLAKNTGMGPQRPTVDLQAISNTFTSSFNHQSCPAFLGCPIL